MSGDRALRGPSRWAPALTLGLLLISLALAVLAQRNEADHDCLGTSGVGARLLAGALQTFFAWAGLVMAYGALREVRRHAALAFVGAATSVTVCGAVWLVVWFAAINCGS